jgi:hypothetical protein
MNQFVKVLILSLFFTGFYLPAFAEETTATPNPTPPTPVYPTAADLLPGAQKVAANAEAVSLSTFADQIREDSWHGKFREWNRGDEKDGRYATQTLYIETKGTVRLYNVLWSWKGAWRTIQYYYDESGRLRVVNLFEAPIFSGKGQRIFLDPKGKIIEVQYRGKFMEEGGRTTEEEKVLKAPALLEDGTQVEMIKDPQTVMGQDPLEAISSKPAVVTQYPFFGVMGGQPVGVNLVAGYDWEMFGLKGEGMYLSDVNYDAQFEIDMGSPQSTNGFMLSPRMEIAYVFGFRNANSSSSTAQFYSGFGLNERIGRLNFEFDLVDNGFWNFGDNNWTGYFRVGLLQLFD